MAAGTDGTATDLIRNLSHGTHNSYQSRNSHGTYNGNNSSNGSAKPLPTPNCCIIPCIDELILDLERLVTLRDEIVYSFETDVDGGGDAESTPDVVTLLREYCALLGALLTVPGLGSLPSRDDDNGDDEGGGTGNNYHHSTMDVHVGGLFLTWHKLDEDETDGTSAMDIDADNSKIEVESHCSVSSLYAERQLSTYLLAVLEYISAAANLNVSSNPANAAQVLSDMAGARAALRAAQLGFGRAAALFDHLRTVIENDLQEDGAIGTCAGTGTGSSPHVVGSDTTTRHSSGSEVGESSIPMIPISPCQLLDPSALHSFHLSSMALGQSCFYYTALMQRKQMHSVLAKLAAGCAEKYETAATFARQMSEDDDGGGGGGNPHGNHAGNIRSYMPSKALIRSTFAAGEYYYFALAEYSEACVANSKNLFGVEVARFSSAIHVIGNSETELLGSYQNELLNISGSNNGGLSSESEERVAALLIATATTSADARFVVGLKSVLCAKVINLHTEISRLMAKAEEAWADDVPTDIPPTRSQTMMKMEAIPTEANFLDPTLGMSYLAASPPLQQLLDRTGVDACTDFHRKLLEMFTSAKISARNATNTAKEELAKMGLPDSISTFKATVEAAKSGRSNKVRGIPSAMAEQIESLHASQGVLLLKQNLYILEEVAALARKTLDETEEMLNETVRADDQFRRQHPTFGGRDVATEHEQIAVSSLDGSGAVETNARQICSKIRTWLDQANEGDQKLCQVLEEIETDPKYRLVMLQLDQLEKLVRGGSGRMNEDEMDGEERTSSSSSAAGTSSVETLALEKQLEHLGTLIASRGRILDAMEKDVLAFNQRERAIQAISNRGNLAVADSQFYDALTDLSLPLFDHHIEKVNNSIQNQQKVFRLLLQLYSKFQLDRSAYEQEKEATEEDWMADTASSPAKAYLQKIASALKTVEWCRPQLVQGRNFYQTVLTNIEELKKKVEDVNAVLASERIFSRIPIIHSVIKSNGGVRRKKTSALPVSSCEKPRRRRLIMLLKRKWILVSRKRMNALREN